MSKSKKTNIKGLNVEANGFNFLDASEALKLTGEVEYADYTKSSLYVRYSGGGAIRFTGRFKKIPQGKQSYSVDPKSSVSGFEVNPYSSNQKLIVSGLKMNLATVGRVLEKWASSPEVAAKQLLSGNDVIIGGNKYAQNRKTVLAGFDGNDKLVAGTAGTGINTWLSGGQGADIFYFANSPAIGIPVIEDFNPVDGDRIAVLSQDPSSWKMVKEDFGGGVNIHFEGSNSLQKAASFHLYGYNSGFDVAPFLSFVSSLPSF